MLRKGILCLCLFAFGFLPQKKPAAGGDDFKRDDALKAARTYCRRLEQAALDFVCREEVIEVIKSGRDDLQGIRIAVTRDYGGADERPSMAVDKPLVDGPAPETKKTLFTYDYQFVRRDGKVTEKRELLKKNGRVPRPEDRTASTEAFKFSDILMSPIQLLDERFQDFYDYRLAGTEKAAGTPAWVLDVAPRNRLLGPYLGGKIWLAKKGGAVLKIEWDPRTFEHYESIVLRAKGFNAEPRVVSLTEFGFEKNGLRFPSRDSTEEAYLVGSDRTKFVRASTTVVYKGYKFFTVETRTDIKN